MPEICRMCSENSVLLVPMVKRTNSKDELEEIGSQFEDCFGIKVLATPDYTSICSLCHKKLCCFYEFKQKVLKTHEELLQRYKDVIITEKDIKTELLDDLDVEYFEDDATCLMFQKLVDGANSLSATSHRSNDGPSSAPSKESIKVESVTDSLDVISSKQTVTPRQIPSPIIKIEGLREKMILLENDKKQKENGQDYDNDDEFDEIQDDELEEIERISLGDIDDILNIEDFNPDEIFEDRNGNESKDGNGTFRCYKCHICKQMFNSKKIFKVHMLKYEQQQKGESASSPSSLAPQVKKPRKTRYANYCDQCGKSFALEETLKAHMNIHRGLPAYSCNICGKGFNQKANYVYHMKNHNNERGFICKICSKAFLGKGDLQIHMRCHNDERPYVCHICGKRYKVLTHLKEHTSTHLEVNIFECKICNLKLHTKQSLRGHMSALHQNYDSRLYCKLCEKQFNRRYRFVDHVKSRHPDESEEMLSKVQYRNIERLQRQRE